VGNKSSSHESVLCHDSVVVQSSVLNEVSGGKLISSVESPTFVFQLQSFKLQEEAWKSGTEGVDAHAWLSWSSLVGLDIP
jgi:hypothetical protein